MCQKSSFSFCYFGKNDNEKNSVEELVLQRLSELIGTTTKNGIVLLAIRNVKLFLKTIW